LSWVSPGDRQVPCLPVLSSRFPQPSELRRREQAVDGSRQTPPAAIRSFQRASSQGDNKYTIYLATRHLERLMCLPKGMPIILVVVQSIVPLISELLMFGQNETAGNSERPTDVNGRRTEEDVQHLLEIGALYDSAPVALCVLDTQGRYLRVNRRMAEVVGVPISQHIGRSVYDVIPGLADKVQTILDQVSETGQPLRDGEISGTTVGQPATERTALLHMLPLKDSKGEVVAVSVAVQEITERKHWEEQLRASEEKYRRLLAILPVAVYICDQAGNITLFNEQAVALWGRRPQVGKDKWCGSLRMFRPDGTPLPIDECPMAKAIFEGRSIPGEEVIIERFDGSRSYVLPYPDPIFDSSGTPSGAINVLVDITPRRQAEVALQKSEYFARKVIESSLTGIYVYDAQKYHTVYITPEYERITGHTLAGLNALGEKFFSTLFHPEDLPNVFDHLSQLSRTSDGESLEVEYRFKTADGRWIWCLSRNSVFEWDEQGRMRQLIGSFLDITQRKQAEEELKMLNHTLEQRVKERTALAEWRASQLQRLAAELTHAEEQQRRQLARVLHDDLQQTLVAAQLGLVRTMSKMQDEGLVAGIERSRNLLDEAIRESRHLTAELSPPLLYDRGLAAGLEWLGQQTEEKYRLTASVQADPTAEPKAETVKVFVFQAARELILNAVKHGHATSVAIRLQNVGESQISLAVADNGVGCAPERLTPGSDAGGFGLFSIHERLNLIGGSLTITSTPGHGTEAIILAPSEQVQLRGGKLLSERIPEPSRPSPHVERIRVFLVDDHPVFRKGLAELLLEQPNIDLVGEAGDGQEAVETVLQLRPNVVLMDVSMPGMDGVEATRRIKEAAPEISIIGLTMHDSGDMEIAMRNAGASDYLAKNAAAEELIAAISKQHPLCCTHRSA
jgi:PAS domain S-box-containing protein